MTNSVPVIEEAGGEATKATRSANALPLLIVEHRETAGSAPMSRPAERPRLSRHDWGCR
jgi:hypothetical protein